MAGALHGGHSVGYRRAAHIIDIATPNHLHAAEAIAAAHAGKHRLLEKPTGLDEAALIGIRDAVRAAGVRTIVFELRYNPFLKFARRMQTSGQLGRIRFARAQIPVARDRLVSRLGVGAHEGERAAGPAVLTNASYFEQRPISWDPEAMRVRR